MIITFLLMDDKAIAKYLCRQICENTHAVSCYYQCKTHGFICKQCLVNSRKLRYVYKCKYCHLLFCLLHYANHTEPIIHTWNCETITIYNIFNRTTATYKLNKTIHSFSDSISIQAQIFLLNGNRLNEFYEFDMTQHKLIKKANIHVRKFRMGLCGCHHSIYSIGGTKGDTKNDCEKYGIIKDTWSILPKLTTARHSCAVFVFNYTWLYTYGGCSEGINLNSIERIRINRMHGWEPLKFKGEIRMTKCLHGMQINGREVIIFGGQKKNASINDECVIIDMRRMMQSRVSDMKKTYEFVMCSSCVAVGYNIYASDNERNMHIYSIKENKWRLWE